MTSEKNADKGRRHHSVAHYWWAIRTRRLRHIETAKPNWPDGPQEKPHRVVSTLRSLASTTCAALAGGPSTQPSDHTHLRHRHPGQHHSLHARVGPGSRHTTTATEGAPEPRSGCGQNRREVPCAALSMPPFAQSSTLRGAKQASRGNTHFSHGFSRTTDAKRQSHRVQSKLFAESGKRARFFFLE